MQIIAHRARGFGECENSLAAFKKASKADIEGIEIDFRATVDGVLVAWHDATVQGKKVRKLTSKEAKHLKLMTLEECLKAFTKRKRKDMLLHIDMKVRGYEFNLLELVDKYDLEKNVIVISRIEDTLKTVQALNPKIPLSFTFVPKFNGPMNTHQPLPIWPFLPRILRKKQSNVQYVNVVPIIGWASSWLIRRVMSKNIHLIVVDEDSKRGNARLERLDVYGTMTNRPLDVKKWLEK